MLRSRPLLLLSLSFPFVAGCSTETAPPEPEAAPAVRIKLFDHMDPADLAGQGSAQPASDPVMVSFDFARNTPERLWSARVDGRSLDWTSEIHSLDTEGGLEGGRLRLGPNAAEDTSRVVFLLEVPALARVRLRGRAKLENNPGAGEASSKEIARVVEHSQIVTDPTARRLRRSRWSTKRLSRRVDPSGWDRFEESFLTRSSTRMIEVQLLHRSGDQAKAVTLFDDIEIEVTELSDTEIHAEIARRYAPNDGNQDSTPWRLRVDLRSADGHRDEVRDSLLLPAPDSIAFALTLPPAETAPRLRFHYGMVEEAFGAPGDGAELAVVFEDESGERFEIGVVTTDPKNADEDQNWSETRMDLTPVAGRTGSLAFHARDMPGSESDPLDLMVLATPRIEPASGTPGEPGAPNILLIGVDTLRADRMSAFGYERSTTPNLAALADVGVRFPMTRAQAPWTLPSFSSIMTSLYPSAHGAGRGGHDEWTPIDPTTTALAEILARVGYETQGIVANGLISPSYGLDQGFEGYQSAWAMESAERDHKSVVSFVAEHTTTPWFLFWHIMDPHLPYSTGETYREQFTEAGYDGRFSRGRRGPYVPFEVLDPRPGRRWFVHEGPPPPPDLEDDDRRFVNDYYDAELAEMDAAIGKVFDALRASGQWDRTIVAIIADHGEGLGDHDHYHHGYTLFDDQVHIPMILRIPGRDEGRVVERPVAAIDLAPTLLGVLGLPVPEFFHGVDRLATNAPEEDAYFIEYPTYDSSAQKGWILGDYKYLHDPVFHTEELYDLTADPGEQHNVASQHPDVVARARSEMDAFRWRLLQTGRFHLRVRGTKGQRLNVSVTTDDLFDANFAALPQTDENAFTMDLERKTLRLDVELQRDRLELVFWCRGDELTIDVQLDGAPVPQGVILGTSDRKHEVPLQLRRDSLPVAEGKTLAWPGTGRALLWLEAGAQEVLPVVLSPEENERLKELGYTR